MQHQQNSTQTEKPVAWVDAPAALGQQHRVIKSVKPRGIAFQCRSKCSDGNNARMTPQGLQLVLLLSIVYVNGSSEQRVINGGDLGELLSRCPCVPINTCYSQGVSLNDQNFLNAQFQCPDRTLGHCCGHFYPTLGSDDFYFDETTDEGRKVPIAEEVTPTEVEETSTEMVLMAPERPTSEKVFIVWPETTTIDTPTTTLEVFVETTTEPVPISTTTTLEDLETTTEVEELTTTTTEAPTTTTQTTTTKSFLTAAQLQRMARLQNRPVFPKLERRTERTPRVSSSSTRVPVRSTRVPTTTTSPRVKSTTTRFPTRKSLYSTDFQQRYIASRLRNQPGPKN